METGCPMKKLSLIPLAVLAISSAEAFAHKVPYGSSHCANNAEEAAEEGTKTCSEEDKVKGQATAFCKFTGRIDVENCAEAVVRNGMAEAAGKCVDLALQRQVDIRDELLGHKTGGGSLSSEGHWHAEYRYSKEEGLHRHDWSKGARDKAGAEYGTYRVDEAKRNSSTNKTTNGTNTSSKFWGDFKAKIGIGGGALGGAEGGTGVDYTTGKSSTTESGPLTDQQIKEVYNKAYEIAYQNPNLTKVNPDIMCEKGKKFCSTSFSRDYVNEDYQPQANTEARKPSSSNGSSGSSGRNTSSGGTDTGTKAPAPSPSKSTTDVEIPSTDGGKWAGDPTPVTKPGEMIANYGQEGLHDPIENCLFESFKETASRDDNKTFDQDGSNKSMEARKKEAEDLLEKGICDESFYGPAYCRKYKTMKLTGEFIPGSDPEDTTVFDALLDKGHIDFANPDDIHEKAGIDLSRIKSPVKAPVFGQ
jgi:hypothetical protein